MSLLRRVYNKIKHLYSDTKFWTSLWVVSGIIAGVVAICIFKPLEKLSFGNALLWAFACFVLGAAGGFIFSIPQLITNTPLPVGQSTLTTTQQKILVKENTNLAQVSDWLTKVIIGAGLVELKEIPKFVMKVAREIGKGLITDTAHIQQAIVLSVAIIVYFSVWGFISGYIVMRLVITSVLAKEGF